MDIISSLLNALGVNETIWLQLACFIVSYLALSHLVFKPYMKAHHEREKRTVGNEESAVRIIEEAQDLHSNYELKAKALNSEIRSIYDKQRSDALKDYETMIKDARESAQQAMAATREKIAQEIQTAQKKLAVEIPGVAQAITNRLLGKDMH